MKTIGLVGGTTPESTRIYYDLLIEGARQPGADPLQNPEIIIYSINLTELVQIQRTGERREVVEFLARIVNRLEAAGAEIAALTANTPHAYLEELRDETSLPFISIVTATRDAAVKKGLKKALILGTRTAVEAEMYPKEFSAAGIEIVRPDEPERQFLDDTIYNDLALGRVTPELRHRYLDICSRHLEENGIDSVILGCTEIPLVISQDDLEIPVLDTTVTHVAAILEAARQENVATLNV